MVRLILRRVLQTMLIGLMIGELGIANAAPVLASHKLPKSVVIIGDSLADGLYAGFYRLMKPVKKISVHKKTRVNTGLVRYDKYNWASTVGKIAASGKFDTAIVSFGANDLISFRGKGRPTHFGEKNWPKLYGERIAEIVNRLKKSGIKVYWVGLPNVRRKQFRKGYKFLNTIFKQSATASGARYIDTWNVLEANGKFSEQGKDINGKTIILRHTDGVHFTPDGYLTYAKIVADEILPKGWRQ